jgi:serine/threonine protein kinase
MEPIGGGGVGDIYRAWLLKLDRTVAVKVPHESLVTNANVVERFQREARAISRTYHPHCGAALDFGVRGHPLVLPRPERSTATSTRRA